jgi:SPP1 gp7 family putative phage head morphogenesis protein
VTLGVGLPDRVLARLLKQSSQQIGGILDTTRDMVRSTIEEGIRAGDSPAQLGDRLQEAAAFGEYRAETVARTETATILNRAAIESYREYGVTHVTVMDGDDDEGCAAADGQVWTLEEAEANPIEHPNCVRDFAPIIGEPPASAAPEADEEVTPLTRPEVRELDGQMRTDYADWRDDLSPEELDALKLYQSSGYRDINATLRGRGSVDVADEVAALDSALSRSVIPHDIVAYRASSASAVPGDLGVGSVFPDLGFASTSIDPVNGHRYAAYVMSDGKVPVFFEIRIPAGTRGAYMDGVLEMREYEVLLARGSRFRVIRDTLIDIEYAPFEAQGRRKGVRKIVLEVIK